MQKIIYVLILVIVILSFIVYIQNSENEAKSNTISNLQVELKKKTCEMDKINMNNSKINDNISKSNIKKQEDISNVKKANNNELIMQFTNRMLLIQQESNL